jgi:hypothetical protein
MFKEKCPQCGEGDFISFEKAEKGNVEVRKFSCGHEARSVIAGTSSELGIKSGGPTYELKSRTGQSPEHRKAMERGSKRYQDSGRKKKSKGI